MSRSVQIHWDRGTVGARWRRPRTPSGAAVLLAHGAGTGQDHHSIVAIREGLAARGHPVLTFDYPYREAGRSRPDRKETLLACHRAAHRWLARRAESIVLAGRSMGGRMATHLAAGDEDSAPLAVGGLVLFGYPLHPAGRPESRRADHLPKVTAPMLFFTGTRDALAQPALVDRWIRPLPNAQLELIEQADHSFRVPKRTGWTEETLRTWMIERTHDWIARRVG